MKVLQRLTARWECGRHLAEPECRYSSLKFWEYPTLLVYECFHQPKILWPALLSAFVEISLHRHECGNHWPLVIDSVSCLSYFLHLVQSENSNPVIGLFFCLSNGTATIWSSLGILGSTHFTSKLDKHHPGGPKPLEVFGSKNKSCNRRCCSHCHWGNHKDCSNSIRN